MHRSVQFLRRVALYQLLVLAGGSLCCAHPDATSAGHSFVTDARFSVDSEAEPSSGRPALLHPRLVLRSVAGTVEPDGADSKDSIVKLTFFGFSFTPTDRSAAQRGDTQYLDKRYRAVQSTNVNSAEYNGGGWARIQLTVDQHLKVQRVFINVPGYAIVLQDRDLTDFAQEYQFDGKNLRLKSKGQHRLDLTSARVDSFTMRWDVDLNTRVVMKPGSERRK